MQYAILFIKKAKFKFFLLKITFIIGKKVRVLQQKFPQIKFQGSKTYMKNKLSSAQETTLRSKKKQMKTTTAILEKILGPTIHTRPDRRFGRLVSSAPSTSESSGGLREKLKAAKHRSTEVQ